MGAEQDIKDNNIFSMCRAPVILFSFQVSKPPGYREVAESGVIKRVNTTNQR